MSQLMRLGFVYELKATGSQRHAMSCFAGCCRFAWNNVLAENIADYEEYLDDLEMRQVWGEASSLEEAKAMTIRPKPINSFTFNYAVGNLKNEKGNEFLKDCYSHCLQSKMGDLYETYRGFFEGRTGYPKYQRKGKNDSFNYPDGFKIDEPNSRVYLPKIGWVRYRNSRDIIGTPKNVTVSREADKWFVSIQTEFELQDPIPIERAMVTACGIDMGVVNFATLSDGTFYPSLIEKLENIEHRIKVTQKRLSHKYQKGKKEQSRNYKKLVKKLSRLHRRKADIRKDYLHKLSSATVKNHDIVCVEDLRIKNMTKSAKGTSLSHGKNVKAKSGLNRSILSEGWGMFLAMLEYKLKLKGGYLVRVPPRNTSRTCPVCGTVSEENRLTQAGFSCVCCGYSENADYVAAMNIKRAGLAQLACEVNSVGSQQQEPTEGSAKYVA